MNVRLAHAARAAAPFTAHRFAVPNRARVAVAAACVAAVTLITAGCGGGADAATDEGAAPVDKAQANALFQQCMEDAGFSVVRDPETGDISGEAGPESFEEQQAASERCRDEHLQGVDGGDIELSSEDQVLIQDAEAAADKCLKDKGFEFPEPGDTSGGTDPQATTFDPQDPAFLAAQEECYAPLMELAETLMQGEGNE